MNRVLRVAVRGVPVPWAKPKQLRVATRAGGVQFVHKVPGRQTEWQLQIRAAAQAKMEEKGWDLLEAPLTLSAYFVMPRPKSLPKSYRAHCKRPDVGKLLRLAEDALAQACLNGEDSGITRYLEVLKRYAAVGEGSGAILILEEKDWEQEPAGVAAQMILRAATGDDL